MKFYKFFISQSTFLVTNNVHLFKEWFNEKYWYWLRQQLVPLSHRFLKKNRLEFPNNVQWCISSKMKSKELKNPTFRSSPDKRVLGLRSATLRLL